MITIFGLNRDTDKPNKGQKRASGQVHSDKSIRTWTFFLVN